ncbi:hypothetical protein [Sphingobacterium griseoflavum]|uniref:Uncharacterized protein n=1 Tax=Sphingobacterium griseoflavum TaxID=1474952 RepID=A0ABQ3HYI0_9SPHI|nr:hypothetical protein [Sphingobacterium griseoflavum]GHE47595.1 hypothetical protein GCM10017764_33410 [Sphingobacterium griseoflavum]
MAYTKDSIFSKIGELLVELNEGYAGLSEGKQEDRATAIVLMEAQAKFLATHFEVFGQLSRDSGSHASSNASIPTVDHTVDHAQAAVLPAEEKEEQKEEIVFTPPVVSSTDAEDKQPIEEEIVETDKKAGDPATDSESVTAKSESEVEEKPEQAERDSTSQTLFSPPVSHNEPVNQPVAVEEERDASTQKPEEKQPQAPAPSEERVVVQEVIQEPKQIVIENSPAAEERKPARPLTLNEMLQQQRTAALGQSATIASQPSKSQERVVDLKSVINLNDKLLFIKDLFNGYSLAYSEAIELLNRYNSFAEADVFLQTNYALKNNWGDKPQTVEKLYAVLRKKFM